MPVFEVRGPNGKTFDVTAPDGATPEQVHEYAKRKFSDAQASSKEAPSKYDPSVNAAAYQANRFQKGAAGLLSLPAEVAYSAADLVKSGLNKIPGYKEYVADPLNSLAPDFQMQRPNRVIPGALSDPNMKAPSRGQEILGGVSEFLGASVLPSAAVVSKAAHVIPAVAAELGAATLGGLGSEVGGLPGAIVGSIVGGNTPILYSKATSLVKGSVPWLKAKHVAAAPTEFKAAIDANPSSAANIQKTKEISSAIESMGGKPFKPTLGQTTGAPGIVAREGSIASKTPEDLSKYTSLYELNTAATKSALDAAFPPGSSIERSAADIYRHSTKALETRFDAIVKRREQLAARLKDVPQQAAGEALVDLRNKAQTTARNIIATKKADVYATADRLNVEVDMRDIVDAAKKIKAVDENTFQTLPPVYKKIFAQYGTKEAELTGRSIPPDLMAASNAAKQKPNASFEELHSLWRESNSQYGAALRTGDAQAQYYLQRVRDSLKSKLDQFEQGSFGELTAKFKDFNKFYSTKYAPAFKEGVGGRIDATGRYGDIVRPEGVVSKFFTPSGIDDFNLIYAGDKNAQMALGDGVVGLFRQKAVRNGKIDPKSASAFMRDNKDALDKIPDIAAILKNPNAANEALVESAARTRENISAFNKSFVAKLAKTENITPVIDRALTDRRTLVELVAIGRQGGPEATATVSRAIADRIPVVAAKQGIDPLAFVVQNEATLKPMLNRLGPKHYENLQVIAGAETILRRTRPPTHVIDAKLGDFVEQVTGSTPRTFWSQSVNATAGRQSPVSAVFHLLSKYGIKVREDNASVVLREAIYNPAVAENWAKLAQGKALTIPESNSLRNHLAASGVRIGAYQGQQ